jgi:alpha-tubulin suppressor-like RCC1 family protein
MPKRKTPKYRKVGKSDGQVTHKRAKKGVPDVLDASGTQPEFVNKPNQVWSTDSKCVQPLQHGHYIGKCIYMQVNGTVYVLGSGDCGQLGLGEDVSEKLRPGPVYLPDDSKVCFAVLRGNSETRASDD